MKISTIRILGYTMIAVGLINLDYQRAKNLALPISAIAVVVGIAFVGLTFAQNFVKKADKPELKYLLSLITIAVLVLQFINI